MIDLFLEYLSRQGKSRHTTKAYRQAMEHFERWYQQSYDLDFAPTAVTPRDVRDWKAFQQTVERASPYTVNQRLTALRRFFGWLVKGGHIKANPVAEIKTKSISERHPQALSQTESRRLIRAIDNPRDKAIVSLMLEAGLRREEVLNLHRCDLIINHRSGLAIVRRGKRDLYREVPLTNEVRIALSAYFDSLNPPLADDAPLWRGQRGPLIDPKHINELVAHYAYLAKLDHVTPHQLRHTFATNYLDKHPGDLRNLAAILGHVNINTVMIYTQPTTETLAEKMEEAAL